MSKAEPQPVILQELWNWSNLVSKAENNYGLNGAIYCSHQLSLGRRLASECF